jgi:hypothetical protein
MKLLATIFLRLEHWELFLLLFVVPTIAETIGVIFIPTPIQSTQYLGTASIFWEIITVLLMSFFSLWFWALGSFLSAIVRPGLRLKMGFFRFALIYPIAYLIVAIPIFLGPTTDNLLIIIPFHLFAMICIVYDLYFVSKSLVLAQTGKGATFYDYAGPFFLIWFYPIGFWIIQPRVNRLFADRRNAEVFAETH